MDPPHSYFLGARWSANPGICREEALRTRARVCRFVRFGLARRKQASPKSLSTRLCPVCVVEQRFIFSNRDYGERFGARSSQHFNRQKNKHTGKVG
jgi:hypothetical protein